MEQNGAYRALSARPGTSNESLKKLAYAVVILYTAKLERSGPSELERSGPSECCERQQRENAK